MKHFIIFSSFLFIIILILSGDKINSQVTQEWAARYDGPMSYEDVVTSVTTDEEGNVYISGYCAGNGTSFDYATLKYNSLGIQQWVQRYNGSGNGNDYPKKVVVDGAGNVYVSGRSWSNNTDMDWVTIKYNSQGEQQWVQRYNGPGNGSDDVSSIAVDVTGNLYVTGRSSGIKSGMGFTTIKYSTSGVQEWIQTYNGPDGNGGGGVSSMVIDNSGYIYITGTTNSDYATIKYNSSGILQWIQIYNGGPGNSSDAAYSIAVDVIGNTYVTGYSGRYIATIKYNCSGDLQWVQKYSGAWTNNNIGKNIACDKLENVYVSGRTSHGNSNDDFDYITLKYNSSGVQQWTQIYDGPIGSEDDPHAMTIDCFGNVYITGSSEGTITTGYDYATVKYNSLGAQQWVRRYSNPRHTSDTHDDAYSIAVDNSNNVFVAGGSKGIHNFYDFTIIKYSQQTDKAGLNYYKPVSLEIPKEYNLSQNYPNPFNPETNIKFSIPNNSFVKLTIYDITGKEIASLVNEQLNAGDYSYNFNASDISSGVYFYRIEAGDFTEVKKMMLIK